MCACRASPCTGTCTAHTQHAPPWPHQALRITVLPLRPRRPHLHCTFPQAALPSSPSFALHIPQSCFALIALICTAHHSKPLCPHRPHLHCTFPQAALPSPPHRDLRPYHPFCTADLPGHLRPHRCRDGVQLGSQPPHQRLRGRGLHGPPARAEAAAGGGCSRART